MEEFMPVAEEMQLRLARWFVELGAWERVLGIYEGNPQWGDAGEWESLRVEALLESGDFEGAKAVMGRMTAGVSALKRSEFRYRIAAGLGGGDELTDSRMKLLRAAAEGDPEKVREAAEYAEGRGDRELAIGLYKVLEKDPEEEVLAKLQVAELQSGAVEGRAGAMAVLESLLRGWPRLEEVRNRLIRMRLLEGRSGADDAAAAVEMAAGARGYAPFQVTAALARLVSGQPKEALELLEGNGGRNRREAEAGNPVVSVAVLAAGGRDEDAKKVRTAMGERPLTAGEKALLDRWMPAVK
jgi:thioredoxin-like negative regulator of GroEL